MTGISTAAPDAAFRPEEFRKALGRFATGVVVLTALPASGGPPAGLAVNSFTSVSLEPPLVLFCVGHHSTSWPRIRDAGRFHVHILAENQRRISARFATSRADKFSGVDWTLAENGIPVIDGVLGLLECTVVSEQTAGDHDVVIARVHHLEARGDGGPLLFHRGGYGRYTALEPGR
ncbi:flavin reductase family protein [Streptomyces sp. NPDC091266]|uniref:flavin reductase family protein n=1 Tax=Streptomyces sp. NPDC091266 TaxID=3365978 RepID=UPI0037F4D078